MAAPASKTQVQTADAPAALGPYSQAIVAGGLVFCAGQVPIDPATGQLVDGDVQAQTQRVLKNLAGVLKAAGAGLVDVVKTTVFLAEMSDFAAMNDAYAEMFGANPPARSTIGVAALPRNARVEIECIAVVPGVRPAPGAGLSAGAGDDFDLDQDRDC